MTDEYVTISNDSNKFSDYIIAAVFCLVFIIVCIPLSLNVIHWFLLPVFFCGILIGVDTVRWARGKYDLFDPKGIFGILGLHLFFLAPILVVAWDYHTKFTAVWLEDYRPWLGLIAFLNVFGLIIYRLVEKKVASVPYKPTAKTWLLNQSGGMMILVCFILIALVGQIYFISTRGLPGRLAYDVRWEMKGGTGIYRLLGQALPILILMFLTIIRSRITTRRSSIIAAGVVLFGLAVTIFITRGLAGSRSATVWTLFWLVGIIHFYWRKITVKQSVVGFIILCTFMFFYGFYKHLGTEGLKRALESGGLADASYEAGISLHGILIGDMSRADIQAYMAYVLVEKPYKYKYRWGKTLWQDILVQFPIWIYPNFHNLTGSGGKMMAGTDIMMGEGKFDAHDQYSKSRYVYGLIGQVMLNFGVLPIPLAYIVLGYCMGRFRRAFLNWEPDDLRFLMAPAVTNFLFLLVIMDFNNLLDFFTFRLAYPLIALFLMSVRVPRYQADEEDDHVYADAEEI